jgi:hypothetical protein
MAGVSRTGYDYLGRRLMFVNGAKENVVEEDAGFPAWRWFWRTRGEKKTIPGRADQIDIVRWL